MPSTLCPCEGGGRGEGGQECRDCPVSEDSVAVLWVLAKKMQPLLASPAVPMKVHLVACVSY